MIWINDGGDHTSAMPKCFLFNFISCLLSWSSISFTFAKSAEVVPIAAAAAFFL